MKIQCDACNKEAASLFCCADEAALCQDCDQRVHHANKLAGKHQRFSFDQLPSSSKRTPLCDICKEKRAFLFCQEDRAILCPDCDITIHTANELTAKHNRFFLTGIKLVAPSTTSPPVVESSVKPVVAGVPPEKSYLVAAVPDNCNGKSEVGGTTSISDYFIKAIPGWHVEDLLDDAGRVFADPIGFSSLDGLFKTHEILKDMEPKFGGDLGYGVPIPQMQVCRVPNILITAQNFVEDVLGLKRAMNMKAAKDQRNVNHLKAHVLYTDDGFTVPQMGPPPKRGKWY